MRILVCVKQVPGTSQVEVDPETGVLKRDGVPAKLNPYDLFALEVAFRLNEEHGGTVTALSMGPPQAKKALLEALHMGADDAVLLSDRIFAGSDVLATARALSLAVTAAAKKNGGFDLILCGKQTTDGDTAQVGAELAEFLDIPHVSNVTSLSLSATFAHIEAETNLDAKTVRYQIKLPCLLCTDGDINTPRLPSFKRRSVKTEADIQTLSLSDMAALLKNAPNADDFGLAGSPTQVERIFPPEKNSEKKLFTGSPAELAEQFAGILQTLKFV